MDTTPDLEKKYLGREVDQIEELIAKLNSKVTLDGSLSYLTKDGYDRIFHQFKMLDTSIYNHKELSIESNDRLDELTDIMSSKPI
ncbi:MAG: hypothetical protein JKY42_08355 [Flavobacteriales bacterium]|nr:hypothetical protein [Flavobacteriales bacterium]